MSGGSKFFISPPCLILTENRSKCSLSLKKMIPGKCHLNVLVLAKMLEKNASILNLQKHLLKVKIFSRPRVQRSMFKGKLQRAFERWYQCSNPEY